MSERRKVNSLSEVTAVLFAGGLGTRLRSVVPDTQKVVASVGGRPFLERHLQRLLQLGITEAVLCTGYNASQVHDCFGNSYRGLNLIYSEETAPLGTGGALGNAASAIKSESALVMNGDSYADFDLWAFWEFYKEDRDAAAMALFQVEDTARYGRVTLEGDNLKSFVEKGASTGSGWVNGGVYLIPHALIEGIISTRPLSLEKEVFPFWVTLRGLRGFEATGGSFIDIGTPETYKTADQFFKGASR